LCCFSMDNACNPLLFSSILLVILSSYVNCLCQTVYLARHGETAYNAEGRIQGTLDKSYLTLNGVDQAGGLGTFLVEEGIVFDRVFCSNMTRARQTLSVVKSCDRCSSKPGLLPPEKVDGLFREIELREWEGLLKVDIERDEPELWRTWRTTPDKVVMRDASRPLVDLWERAGECWSTVLSSPTMQGSNTLIVCHGALGKAMIAKAMGEEIRAFRDSTFALTNAECVEIEFVDGVGKRWRRRHPNEGEWHKRKSIANLRGGWAADARPSCRRRVIAQVGAVVLSPLPLTPAFAAGSSLQPIVDLETSIIKAKNAMTVGDALSYLRGVPLEEKQFKAPFDAFAAPLSYKDKFKNNNAFLVYYTGGFDGPGRPNIEVATTTELVQQKRNGFRNDAWFFFDEAKAELEFLRQQGYGGNSVSKDAVLSLDKAAEALSSYISLAE